jgi:REP element-mobilizing transposase RayT
MSQSLSNLLVHIISSTKERRPFLADVNDRAAMHRYLGAVSARLDCPVIRVGGIVDHVHCLARQSRTITVADWVKELKRASSQWAKTQSASLRAFQWQAGYGAFSVSQSLSQKVEQYIEGQEAHHRTFDFQTEFRKLCDAHGVEYDERYVWD